MKVAEHIHAAIGIYPFNLIDPMALPLAAITEQM